MSKMNTVKNYKSLIDMYNLIKPSEGQYMYCEEEGKGYFYHEGEWQEVPKANVDGNLELSLYDLNAQLISQLPTYNAEACDETVEAINKLHTQELNSHYMLLCKEQSYFTIFEVNAKPLFTNEFTTLGDAVMTICAEIGEIKNAYANTNGDFDIWVLPPEGDIWCLHLFPYDMGVVKFG